MCSVGEGKSRLLIYFIELCLFAGVISAPGPNPGPLFTSSRVTAKSVGVNKGIGNLGGGYTGGIGFGVYGGRYNTYASGFGYNPVFRVPTVYSGVAPLQGGAVYQQRFTGFNGGLNFQPPSRGLIQPLFGGFVNDNHHSQLGHQQHSGYYGSAGGLDYNGAGATFTHYQPHYYP